MAMTFFEKTASSIVHAIAAEHERCPSARRRPYHPVAEFAIAQVAHMTSPLRLPMRLATCGLSLMALVTTGTPLHRLPDSRRRRLLGRWRTSAIGPVRDVVRFYDSLTVLALYGPERT